ncbi:MAG: hypothetical protein WAN33_00010 [Candidatus Acidiferrales bacterium]
MSESPDKFRREFLEKLKYMLGEKRWLQLVEIAESGELEKHRQGFFEMIQSDEPEQYLERFKFKREFPGAFN